MPLRARKLASFGRDYAELSEEDQARAADALEQLLKNPRHPSLRTTKLQGVVGLWEARLDSKRRFVFEWNEDLLILMRICSHDVVQREIKRRR